MIKTKIFTKNERQHWNSTFFVFNSLTGIGCSTKAKLLQHFNTVVGQTYDQNLVILNSSGFGTFGGGVVKK